MPSIQSITAMRNCGAKLGVLLLVLVFLQRSAFGQSESLVLNSPVMPFEELFVIEDTIRLDSSVLLGQIRFMDVNEAGELLIEDGTDGGIHLFSPSGKHLQSYAVTSCLPGETGQSRPLTRFMGNGNIISIRQGRMAIIFGRDGSCIQTIRDLGKSYRAYCVRGDSIAAYAIGDEGEASVDYYSTALEPLRSVHEEPSGFPFLNRGRGGISGRDIACFDDGVYYVYRESTDGFCISCPSAGIRYRPEFAERRTRDVPFGDYDQSKLVMEVPMNLGVFAVDRSTRMTVFTYLDQKWYGATETDRLFGYGIASKTGLFPGRSTTAGEVLPITMTAGNGYVYAAGDAVQLPDGEFGNPVIVRYRFIAPARDRQ